LFDNHIISGTNNIIQIPDLSDTLINTLSIQTLNNKTLETPTIHNPIINNLSMTDNKIITLLNNTMNILDVSDTFVNTSSN
jgi:hypothetical protein